MTEQSHAAYVPPDAKVCRPECRDPDYNECADCWKDGGNPALYPSLAPIIDYGGGDAEA